MSKSNEEPKWYKPEQDRQMDAIDHEIFAIAKIHSEVIKKGVGISQFILGLIRIEYVTAQILNGHLLPEERPIAIRLLRNREAEETTLEILLRVIALRNK